MRNSAWLGFFYAAYRRVSVSDRFHQAVLPRGNGCRTAGHGTRVLPYPILEESAMNASHQMKAREMMRQPVVSVRRETSVAEAARAMVDRMVGCILVVDNQGRLRGIITQTDFADDQHGVPFSMEALLQKCSRPTTPEALERLRKEARTTMVEQIMVTEVITGTEDTPMDEMARLMLRYDIEHIPIVRDGVPVGIVARHDFLRLIAEEAKSN